MAIEPPASEPAEDAPGMPEKIGPRLRPSPGRSSCSPMADRHPAGAGVTREIDRAAGSTENTWIDIGMAPAPTLLRILCGEKIQ
jgi:hypothetical protein